MSPVGVFGSGFGFFGHTPLSVRGAFPVGIKMFNLFGSCFSRWVERKGQQNFLIGLVFGLQVNLVADEWGKCDEPRRRRGKRARGA